MLLMLETRIRDRICRGIHQYVEPNNKYMRHYDKTKESSYLIYYEMNSSYGHMDGQYKKNHLSMILFWLKTHLSLIKIS